VVFLHSLAMDHSVWDGPVAALRPRYEVVTCDLPGHGRSAPLEDISIESMADAVAAMLASQAGGPAMVVGMSMGGCVAQQLAARHPDRVRGLLLADTTAWYGADAPQRWRERADRAATDGLASLAEFQVTRWFSQPFRDANPQLLSRLLDVFIANDLSSYARACRAMGAYDGRASVAGLSVPALVLVGEKDVATPVADAQDLGRRLGCEVRVIPGAGHMSPLERTDLFLAAIEDLHKQLS
jgi:3-oxoadipate enol-lactonase